MLDHCMWGWTNIKLTLNQQGLNCVSLETLSSIIPHILGPYWLDFSSLPAWLEVILLTSSYRPLLYFLLNSAAAGNICGPVVIWRFSSLSGISHFVMTWSAQSPQARSMNAAWPSMLGQRLRRLTCRYSVLCGASMTVRWRSRSQTTRTRISNYNLQLWSQVSSAPSHHPREVFLVQFILYVHKCGPAN